MSNPPKSQLIRSYRDLEAWQLAMEAVVDTYRLSRAFPPDERYGLTAQIRRAAVAIPSNIAEGRGRLGPGEFRHGVSTARGSVAEVETQFAVAVALDLVDLQRLDPLNAKLDRLSKMLFGLYKRLER